MAASLDKQMLLRKFRQVQKKNANPDAAGVVMLLFVVPLFMPSTNKKTKGKRNSRYLEPTQSGEVSGVLFLGSSQQ